MTTEIETWLPGSRVGNNSVVDHRSRRRVFSSLRNCVDFIFHRVGKLIISSNAGIYFRPRRRNFVNGRYEDFE